MSSSSNKQRHQPTTGPSTGGTASGGGGRGTISYDLNKPTHAFSSSGTTEFDDELLRRQIVTPYQVFAAKGATPTEAQRLATEWTQNKQQDHQSPLSPENPNPPKSKDDGSYEDDDDDDYFLDDDNDDFMKQYRQQRLTELQKEHNQKHQQFKNTPTTHGPIIRHISRQDWSSQVNERSHRCWVVICMTDKKQEGNDQDERRGNTVYYGNSDTDSNNSSRYHDRVVEELHRISREFNFSDRGSSIDVEDSNDSTIHFLTIYYKDAIPNWPSDHIPAMFAYRHGIKQHEWITTNRGSFLGRDQLEVLFRQWKII